MARRKVPYLQRIENQHDISVETDPVFWYALQNALLLALQERSVLSEDCVRCALEHLKRERGMDYH